MEGKHERVGEQTRARRESEQSRGIGSETGEEEAKNGRTIRDKGNRRIKLGVFSLAAVRCNPTGTHSMSALSAPGGI